MIDPNEHKKRMEKHREEQEKMEKWFWRIFYAALFFIILSFFAAIAIVIFVGMNLGQIVDFLRGFQIIVGGLV